jgi:hypothetical protein
MIRDLYLRLKGPLRPMLEVLFRSNFVFMAMFFLPSPLFMVSVLAAVVLVLEKFTR